jgi:hypothetical protein
VKTQSYIGVTGFMEPAEIEALQAMFSPGDSHKLMVGLLVSYKTWHGIPSRYPHLFPDPSLLQELASAVDVTRAFALVHYNAKGPRCDNYASVQEYRQDEQQLYWDCRDILRMVDSWTRDEQSAFCGFQINFPLPSKMTLVSIENHFRRIGTDGNLSVLQVWPQSIQSSPRRVRSNQAIAKYIDTEYGVATNSRLGTRRYPFGTILYDVSGGFAQDLDPSGVVDSLEPFISLCQKRQHLRLAVAGGLCAETVGHFRPLVQAYPQISIDAQGKLRAPDGTMNIDAAKRYIEAAQQLLSS